ncbi:hypothetical protein MKZ38_009137 [Zalerion maritima]|uniref:Uncharacterized protein n=1 Tax=Zalerion maritima TaxID=339359 RepID=A0AAD5WNP6_9PEZI|nr:hypothetical protein MKZ38_009137 [Zalerion maritima]
MSAQVPSSASQLTASNLRAITPSSTLATWERSYDSLEAFRAGHSTPRPDVAEEATRLATLIAKPQQGNPNKQQA